MSPRLYRSISDCASFALQSICTKSGPDAGYCLLQAFEQSYRREFGFILEGRKISVDDMRVRASGRVRPSALLIHRNWEVNSIGIVPDAERHSPRQEQESDRLQWHCRALGCL